MKCSILALLCIFVLGGSAQEWYKNAVFYQIYPKSFKDSDANGTGDIKGITSKLDHLKDLGVDGAWLSPIFQSPQKDGGYDISDFTKVDPLFGTNEDLKALFAEAKKLGLKIILDFVPNHTSDQHEWFQKSENLIEKYKDYYVWKDPVFINGTQFPPNNWIAVFQNSAWTWSEKRQQYYLHQFTKFQPDLNFRSEAVKKELDDMLLYWLDEGADGFRIDAINHAYEHESFDHETYIDPNGDKTLYSNLFHNLTMDQEESYELVYHWRELLDNYSSDKKIEPKFLMTEAYSSIENQVRWYGNNNGSIKGSHMPFNFALISELTKTSNANDFQKAIQMWMDNKPEYGIPNWVLGNHDRSRFGSRYGVERHESLAVLTMTLPGINVVYYGEEIVMVDNTEITWNQTQDPQACNSNETVFAELSRDPVRTPFQWTNESNAGFSESTNGTWLPIHTNYKDINLLAQTNVTNSTFELYKRLIKLRKDNEVLRDGDYAGTAIKTSIFAFTRHIEDNDVVVVINLKDTEETLDLTELESIKNKPKGKVLVITNGAALNVDDTVDLKKYTIGGYEAVVFEASGANKVGILSGLLFLVISIMSLY